MIPEQEADHLFLGYKQKLADNITLGVKAYYSSRENTFFRYPLGDVAPAPFDISVSPPDLDPAIIEAYDLPDPSTVGPGSAYDYPAGAGFSYGVHPDYEGRTQETEMSTWGIAPTLTLDFRAGGSCVTRSTLAVRPMKTCGLKAIASAWPLPLRQGNSTH